MTTEGWARPELLCETDWLADHVDDANVALIDCDLLPAYQRLHIPGAAWSLSHYWKQSENDEVHAISDADAFAKMMGRMGIDNDTHVVAYDGSGGLYAERLWWTLKRFGHTNCQVLNGGLDKWQAEGRPLTRANYRPEPKTFVAPSADDASLCRLDDVAASAGDAGHVFWDTRSDGEWMGKNTRGTKRGGRIPGAVHLEWQETLNQPVRTLKEPAELRKILESAGITPDKTVTTY